MFTCWSGAALGRAYFKHEQVQCFLLGSSLVHLPHGLPTGWRGPGDPISDGPIVVAADPSKKNCCRKRDPVSVRCLIHRDREQGYLDFRSIPNRGDKKNVRAFPHFHLRAGWRCMLAGENSLGKMQSVVTEGMVNSLETRDALGKSRMKKP